MKQKALYSLLALVAAVLLLSACVADLEPYGKGWLVVSQPTIDLTTETRTDGEAAEGTTPEQQPEEGTEQEIDYLIHIKQGGSAVYSGIPYSALPSPIALSEGNYSLMAENCTRADAEAGQWGQPRYVGTTGFGITAGETTRPETVICTMANAAVLVKTDANFFYDTFTVTATAAATDDREALTRIFTADGQTGYFNVNTDGTSRSLTYTVEASDTETAQTGSSQGTLSLTLKAKTRSILTLKATAPGQINLEITCEPFTPLPTIQIPVEE